MKNPSDKRSVKKKSKNKKSSNGRNTILIFLLVLLLVAGATGGTMFYLNKNQSKIDVYSVDTLNCADWWENDTQLSGTLTSDYMQEVHLEDGKEVEKIYVKQGDRVKEGDILLKYNVEEQELNLQLQELQMKTATFEIEEMEKELEDLKKKKTTGAISGGIGENLLSASDTLSVKEENITFLAEGEGEEVAPPQEPETPPTTEKEPETPPTTEKEPETPPATEKEPETPPTTEEKKEDPVTPPTTEEDQTTEESKTEGDSSDTTESTQAPAPDDGVKEDIPIERNVQSLEDRAKYSSGDGKSEKTPYVFLFLKSEKGESRTISGSLINELIRKGIYAVFKEYDSMDSYQQDPGKPSQQIAITPTSTFAQQITDNTAYTIADLNSTLVTISKITITPSRTTVNAGATYSFQVKVTGKNLSGVNTKWGVSGASSKDTTINAGRLRVASSERASKITITVTVNDKSASMSMNVVKRSSATTGSTSGNTSGGNNYADFDDDADFGDGGDVVGETTTDMVYTADELKQAIADKETEISQAKTDLAEARISYKEAKKEVENATIRAKISGEVQTAYTKDHLPDDNSAVIVISSDKGIYVKTQVNEMDLETVKVGGTISCSSWETEGKYEAVVKEVSDYPSSSANPYDSTNPNSSYYPVIAYIADAEGLYPGQSVTITYSSHSMGNVSENAIYLQKAYVRSDSDGRYVFKVGEKDRLVKQYIKTGKTLNGQYIEVLRGISGEDYITFPYGKKVKEGAKTKIAESEENIIY